MVPIQNGPGKCNQKMNGKKELQIASIIATILRNLGIFCYGLIHIRPIAARSGFIQITQATRRTNGPR
jgi:hypothetical protein